MFQVSIFPYTYDKLNAADLSYRIDGADPTTGTLASLPVPFSIPLPSYHPSFSRQHLLLMDLPLILRGGRR